MKAGVLFLLLSALLLSILSCRQFDLEAPEGFAESSSNDQFRAISPEGVVLRVRSVRNNPVQDLVFWSKALENQLTLEGYIALGQEGTLDIPSGEGWYKEWGVPYGAESFVFLTAIFLHKKAIFIAEAAGEGTQFARHREAIMDSLTNLKFK